MLLRESRTPLSPMREGVRQYLEELEQQRVVCVFPAVDALAALDALRELLSDAKSGDLAFHGDTISPQTVEQWLAAHLEESVDNFAEEILGKPVARPFRSAMEQDQQPSRRP